jgi:multiple sugar transport system substrate-binding protein
MEEIELSVMLHNEHTAEILQPLLTEFEFQNNVHVTLTCLDWVTARAELNKAALYHRGPDVSEIGSTWIPDMISMNVLQPFRGLELSQIGKADEFVSAAWQSGQIPGDDGLWAIPWLAETYIIHYRKDLLRKAGIDETSAFSSHARIAETAGQLAQSGVDVPLELTLQTDRYGSLHALASWIWGYGGQFLDKESKHTLLDHEHALNGIIAYFDLMKYTSPTGRAWMLEKSTRPLFHEGKSTVTFGTARLAMPDYDTPQELKENWGWAALPQPCFVGGSNLIVWEHSRNKKSAGKLVKFLTETRSLLRSNHKLATLPPRISALETDEFTQDPMLSVMSAAIKTGRSYPALKLWGLVEDRLVASLLQIGHDILSNPEADSSVIIRQQIQAVCRRINMTLSQ